MSNNKTESQAQQFRVIRHVTLPLLKCVIDTPVYVNITSPIFTGKETKQAGDKKMEPAKLINCINLETGEDCQLIVGAVLESILTEEYAENSYVGRSFSITKGAKATGKQYNPYSVAEVELV